MTTVAHVTIALSEEVVCSSTGVLGSLLRCGDASKVADKRGASANG